MTHLVKVNKNIDSFNGGLYRGYCHVVRQPSTTWYTLANSEI